MRHRASHRSAALRRALSDHVPRAAHEAPARGRDPAAVSARTLLSRGRAGPAARARISDAGVVPGLRWLAAAARRHRTLAGAPRGTGLGGLGTAPAERPQDRPTPALSAPERARG